MKSFGVPDLKILCYGLETPALYLSFRTSHEGSGRKPGRPRRLKGWNGGFKDPGRRGRRRPEDPWLKFTTQLTRMWVQIRGLFPIHSLRIQLLSGFCSSIY